MIIDIKLQHNTIICGFRRKLSILIPYKIKNSDLLQKYLDTLFNKLIFWQVETRKTLSQIGGRFSIFTRYHVSNYINGKKIWMIYWERLNWLDRNTGSKICCKLSIDNNILHWNFQKHPSPDENALLTRDKAADSLKPESKTHIIKKNFIPTTLI